MTIDELITQFGYTRRTLHTNERRKNFDSNLESVKAGTDSPGNYQVGEPCYGFILVTDKESGFSFCIYDSHFESDNYAYDGTEEWKEGEKERLGLSDAELELKIYLDTILEPWFDDSEVGRP